MEQKSNSHYAVVLEKGP